MAQKKNSSQILLEIISLCEQLEDIAIREPETRVPLEQAQTYFDLINWSYNARLALGYEKQTVLDKWRNTSDRLERAMNTIKV